MALYRKQHFQDRVQLASEMKYLLGDMGRGMLELVYQKFATCIL